MLNFLQVALIALFVTSAGVARAQDKEPGLGDVAPAEGTSGQPAPIRPPPDSGRGAGLRPGAIAGDDQVEQVLDAEATKAETKAAPKVSREEKPKNDVKVETLSDLATLAPFDDIAVIQRRFLPKTGRFELSVAGFSNLNNPFYNSLGGSLRAAYYFREQYAAEVIAGAFGTSSRQSTEDLKGNRAIATDNVVTSKSFGVVAFKWNPVYGKITWLNRGIVPFDMNFSLGGGLTQTTGGENAPTLHMGTSQVFALSKWVAFRWDLMWNIYSAKGTDQSGREEQLSQNDLFLGVGLSLYFPEATYR